MNTNRFYVNIKNRPHGKESVTAIIRAHGNEPVQLVVVGYDGDTVKVVGNDPSQPVGFPIQWVYSNDEGAFEKLLAAYEAGDSEKLLALWKTVSRFNGEE